MLNKIKLAFAHFICLFTPKAYVDIINEAANISELDDEILRRSGFNDRP